MAKPKNKKKTSPERRRQLWKQENMEKAVRLVLKGEAGYQKASKMFELPQTTLERYVREARKKMPDVVTVNVTPAHLGRKPILRVEIENELKKYCIEMESKFFGLIRTDIMRLAFRVAQEFQLKHSFSQHTERAGWKWMRSFLKRNPELSVRKPQGTSYARLKGFTQENVNRFFDIYEEEIKKINYDPTRLFNVDETGITIVQHKSTSIIGLKGKRKVGTLQSLERGHLVTVVTCMSASGQHLPPKLIFPRKNMDMKLLNGTPPGTTYSCHPSGWIQAEIFTEWLQEFINFVRPTEEKPVLLILDGHYSHTRNLDVINMARKGHVIIVCLPSHCTHRMQPLDCTFMSPFKTAYAQAIEQWLKHHMGRVVTIYEVGQLLGKAFVKAATFSVAINGFRVTGLYPVNRNVFTESDFVAESFLKTFECAATAIIELPNNNENHSTTSFSENRSSTSQENTSNSPTNQESSAIPCTPSTSSSQGLSVATIANEFIFSTPTTPAPVSTRKKRTTKASTVLITGSPHKKAIEAAAGKPKPRKVVKLPKKKNW